MSEKTAVRLPKPEEVEMIKMNARRAFEFEGVKFDDFKSGENGKLTITAAIPSAKRDAIVAALFGFGIVMIETGNDRTKLTILRSSIKTILRDEEGEGKA